MKLQDLEIYLGPEALPTSKGKPILPRKNAHLDPSGKSKRLTKRAREFRSAMRLWAVRDGVDMIIDGTWKIGIIVTEDSRRKLDGIPDLGLGDVDSTLAPILDALQHAKIIDDDVRFVMAAIEKRYCAGAPSLRIRLERVT